MSVHLGFAVELQPNELFSLKRQFLPLGKVGGKPAWLNPVELPAPEQLICSICQKALAFLLQVYCTGPSNPSHAFHRSLYVFVCRDPQCSRTNDASNFVIFRCQLSRQNAYYHAESALDPWTTGDVPDPHYNDATFARLCRLCGCRATKKCAKCMQQWYCSREHQVMDWSAGGHKHQCGKVATEATSNIENNDDNNSNEMSTQNPFLFKEYGMEMGFERVNNDDDDDYAMDHDQRGNGVDNEDADDSDDEEEEGDAMAEEAEQLATRLRELKKFENCEISAKDLEGIEERVKDTLYKAFHRAVTANPTQILRYERGGAPLLATDHSPRPFIAGASLSDCANGAAALRPVPNCELCGAPRQFEMQLMPHLLSLIDVDQFSSSIDWATLMVFTCSRDCAVPNDSYAREFVFKQDFVEENVDEQKGET